jgi:hypothetical protein
MKWLHYLKLSELQHEKRMVLRLISYIDNIIIKLFFRESILFKSLLLYLPLNIRKHFNVEYI